MAPPAASLAGLPWPELRGYIDQQSASAAARAPVADLLAQAEVHDRAVAAAQAVVGPGSNEGMLVAYLSFCNAVVHTMTNPRFAAAKKDPAFRARIDRLKVVSRGRREERQRELKARGPRHSGWRWNQSKGCFMC
jgi:hypothetical protein